MKLKPRVPEENMEPLATAARLTVTPCPMTDLNEGGCDAVSQTRCEPLVGAVGGRRDFDLESPIFSTYTHVCRGGGCAARVLVLTRGGPWRWSVDNYDLDDLSKVVRLRDAYTMEVGRTHSSRENELPMTCVVTCGEGKTARKCESISSSWKEDDSWRRRGEHHRRQATECHATSLDIEKPTGTNPAKPPIDPAAGDPYRSLSIPWYGRRDRISKQPKTISQTYTGDTRIDG